MVAAGRRLARLGLCLLLGACCLSAEQQLDIKVIGAGPSRTGTQSLGFALHKLGYRSAHGHWYFWNPDLRRPWKDWLHRGGPLEPALQALAERGMDATLDVPVHGAYRELMQRFPNAKVILTVRGNAESWYRSMMTFNPLHKSYVLAVYIFVKQYRNGFSVREAAAGLRALSEDYIKLLDCDTEADPLDPEVRRRCIAGYEQLVAEVRREVPPERLLVFNVKEGWGPLCKFLGVQVPPEPFPRVDGVPSLGPISYKWMVGMATSPLFMLGWGSLCSSLCGCLCWCSLCGCRRLCRAAGAKKEV
mmetsp:Transcript_102586/g.306435  ORF Transcript_102586/g.306435 Transcript_102586/m.306435 type:complete len:303 (+) Transcript_102586:51-959(+)